MKVFPFVALLQLALAIPAPEDEGHHFHKRDAEPVVTVMETITSVVYESDGVVIAATGEPAYKPSSEAVTTSGTTETIAPSSVSAPPTSATSNPSSSSYSSVSSSPSKSGGIYGDLSLFESPSDSFEDGRYDCSAGVPTGNGVISLDWVGYDGWASIMNANGDTVKTCQDGYWCSYACQAGMSKTQWPDDQPSDGQSRGGLICKNGKLYRTNKSTDHLCVWGAKSANAVSKIDKVISLCRTDYPGSENMVVPTRLEPGSTQPMSVVVAESYFKWLGKPTSSQYYVNDAGVDVEEGCVWGTSAGTIGNWAPVVIGSGQTAGITYLSLIPNPNNKTPPSYSIKIEGADGASTVGSCSYENGQYNGGSGSDGCTFSVTSGTANFVFY